MRVHERLGDELIPCPPDHSDFEPLLRAMLRRYVVEHCIYAVDLDPLAVELCRLSLWIETMDRTLPFSFLDHKIKCGNSLVGAWFDQFAHYPVMAWKNRQGGDQNHTNGVHFKKGARTKAIKEFVKDRLTPDLVLFLRDPDLFLGDRLTNYGATHRDALTVLEQMHVLPVQDTRERARLYREEFVASPEWLALKRVMNLWCACWFWPADEISCAPLPTTFTKPSQETLDVAHRISSDMRFFHWELEFPDVFRDEGSGFDAVLGNPPWDVAKPSSHEFFSNIDPLYRSYGKQEAIRKQTSYFVDASSGIASEHDWIDYNARFRSQSNYVKYAARPFGDPTTENKSVDRFSIERGRTNDRLHRSWRRVRNNRSLSLADATHPFCRQGSADLNLYKLFLETSHALLKPSGRMGLVVPSGLYSDYGTAPLRTVFLEQCKWEWIFGIENRNKVFPIHRSYKFNPVVVQKGGSTHTIHTAFMRHDLDDWDRAEAIAIPYARAQAEQFSPRTRTLLEIQSKRDLEVLEKVYANGVLLGDDGANGWGIQYTCGFHMTNDSKLFPPRAQWEAKGYRPDEYSRWLLGRWRPIEELWAELGVDPSRPNPVEVDLEEWLFDLTAGPERREAEARFAYNHLLKPGDVARTKWRVRCAPPPYDRLPVPRALIPEGVFLSREGNEWIREEDVKDLGLPLYVGTMIYVHSWAAKSMQSESGGRLDVDSDYLLGVDDMRHSPAMGSRTVFRKISNATNERSFIPALLPGWFSCGDGAPLLIQPTNDLDYKLDLCALAGSFVFDWAVRQRMSGTNLNWHIVRSLSLPPRLSQHMHRVRGQYSRIALAGIHFAHDWRQFLSRCTKARPPQLHHGPNAERQRILALIEAVATNTMGVSSTDLRYILADCDYPKGKAGDRPAKGFWRVDKDKPPELRQTILALIASCDLEDDTGKCDGDSDMRTQTFLDQNHGEGWLLPETLRLADYGLGHDERAKRPQPVASRLGPRFYDWQLAQSPAEAWRECRVHARNLFGAEGYSELTADTSMCQPRMKTAKPTARYCPDLFRKGDSS